IPMFVVGTLLFLFRMIIPGTNTTPSIYDLPRNLVLPYDVYWYLFSLFLIFIVITFVDAQPFFQRTSGWLNTMLVALLMLYVSENFLDPVPNLLSFKGAAYLFPYFLLGIGIYRFPQQLLHRRATMVALILLVTGIVIQQTIWFGDFPHHEKHGLLGMTVGFTASLLLFSLRLNSGFLIFIGSFAYTIFLFHVFFTGGSRIVLMRLGIENQVVILLSGVAMAIFFSIALDLFVRRFPLLRFCLLGLRKSPKKGAEKP